MGASEFIVSCQAKSAREAFKNLVEEAEYENGHGGYTGTIAEKHSYKMVTPRPDESPAACIDRHMDADTFGDKWGPAGCVEGPPGTYTFFGCASD